MRARVRKHLGTIIVAAVVGALAAGGPAVAGSVVDFARHAGDADTVDGIDASRKPLAGQLLALNANRKFPASVVPAGATGPPGPAGPAGLKGDPGPQGPKGEAGATGARGATGAQGSTGAAGAKGEKGDAGAAGAKGDKGEAGEPGAKGEKGDTGSAGATGASGDKGDQGIQGVKGDAGAAGAKGDKGDAGANGAAGEKGETGAAGANGSPGEKGEKGDIGPAGAKGDKGDVGPAGSAAAYSPIVDINPILRPSRSNLWDRIQVNGNSWFNGYRSSFPTGTDASYLEWDVPLQSGTWTIDVVYTKSSDAGIMTLSLGGTDLAPAIDGFRPEPDGIGYNQIATFSGVNVSTTGIHSVRIRIDSKNALSNAYFGYLVWIRLVRE